MTGPELRPMPLEDQMRYMADISQVPQIGRPPGDAQQRWGTYFLYEGWVLDDIAEGTSTVDALIIGTLVNGVHSDPEAMAWAEENGKPKLLDARGLATVAMAPPNNGAARRDIIGLVNSYRVGTSGRALPDPWSDAVINAVIGSVVMVVGSIGISVFRAGMTQGWAQLFVQAPVRQQISNVARGAQISRMAGPGSRQFLLLPKVTSAMKAAKITEETLIRAAMSKRGIQSILRSQLRDTYIRTAWYSTATATAGQLTAIVDNAINAAENDMADLDAIAIADANTEMTQALEETEQPQGFLEEAEAVWGGRGIQTRPDPNQPPGLQNLVVNGETVTDPRGNPVTLQLTGNESPQEIADALAVAGRTGLDQDDPLIGVPPGGFAAQTPSYIAEYDKLRKSREGTQGGLVPEKLLRNEIVNPTTVFVQAEYRYSDVGHVLFNMTPGQTEAFQMRAIDAGLINPDIPGFALGSRGQQTIDAMETTMVYANNMGRDWQGSVEILANEWQVKLRAIEDEEKEANRRIYSPQPFMALDTAFTAQMVKEDIRRRLGREPNQAELQTLQSYIASEYRTSYEENERVLRADFAAQGRVIEDRTEQDGVSGMQVDWDARFTEEFEDRYAAELDRKARTEQTESKRGDLMASFRLGQNI